MQEVYLRAGGFGRYQLLVLFVHVIAMIGPALLIANLVYFELKPNVYVCHYRDGITKPCGLETICSEPRETRLLSWEVDESISNGLIHNIVSDFGMECENKFSIGLIGSMYFFGEAFGSLAYIVFAKEFKSNRINHIRLKNILSMIILWSLVAVFRSVLMLYLCLFIVGIVNSIGVIQGYAFILE